MLGRIAAVVRRHVWEAARNPDRIADVVVWPLLDVATWGLFSRYLARGHAGWMAPSQIAPSQLVCGIVLWGVFRGFQRDVTVGVLAEIWSRNIVGLFASPLRFGEYLAALFIVNLAKLAVVLGLVVGVCRLASGMPGWTLGLQLAAPLALLVGAGGAIGLFVTSLVLRVSTRVQSLAYGLAGVLMPLSCVFYPLASLPPVLRAVSRWLPTTWAFEAMRESLQGRSLGAGGLVPAGCGVLAACLAAGVLFRVVIRSARRSGRLVRLD